MSRELEELLARVKENEMTPAQFSEQRRSFVFGNTNIENDMITREIVAEAERKVEAEKK